jgi:hypothetical protein
MSHVCDVPHHCVRRASVCIMGRSSTHCSGCENNIQVVLEPESTPCVGISLLGFCQLGKVRWEIQVWRYGRRRFCERIETPRNGRHERLADLLCNVHAIRPHEAEELPSDSLPQSRTMLWVCRQSNNRMASCLQCCSCSVQCPSDRRVQRMFGILGEDTNRQQDVVVQARCPPWNVHGSNIVSPGPFRHHRCHHERQVLHGRRYRTSHHGNAWEFWSREWVARLQAKRNPVRSGF